MTKQTGIWVLAAALRCSHAASRQRARAAKSRWRESRAGKACGTCRPACGTGTAFCAGTARDRATHGGATATYGSAPYGDAAGRTCCTHRDATFCAATPGGAP